MPAVSREELRNQLKKQVFAPVYTLFGAESYLRDLAAKTIRDLAMKSAAFREFNESSFSLTTPESLADALAAAEQLPMMAERRVVVISNVRITSTGAKDSLKDDSEALLLRYLDNPSPTSIVLFIADELDKRRKAAKHLLEKTIAVEFDRMDDVAAAQWVRSRMKDEGFEPEDSAVKRLVAYAGDDLRRLANETDKVMTAMMPDKVVTGEMVSRLVSDSREISNFELTDRLMAKDKKRSLEVLHKILDEGGEPLMLLGLIASNFRKMLLAKSLMEHGIDRAEVIRHLKLPWRMQDEFLASARRADVGRLKSAIERLAETDVAIKTSKGGGTSGPRHQIEVLVCELVN